MLRHGRFSNGGPTIGAVMVLVVALFLQRGGAQTTSTDDSSSNPDPYNYTRFSPSMAIILVIFIVVVFMMGFFAVYIRHCSAAARGSISPLGISARASRRGQRGLDPAVLRTFPTFTYSEVKSHKIGKGALECAVCLNEFADEETLKLLPKCDHVFHPDCIDVWLASHSTCPVCRANLEQATETTRNVEPAPEPSATESSGDGAISEIPELPRSASVAIANPEAIQRSKSSNRPTRSLSMKSIFFFSKFPRSNSTGHCVVEPGENIDRFTLKLPSEIRNQIMNRTLNRSVSVVVLPNESSLRKGFRTGGELGSGRGVMDRALEDRWWFGMGTGLFTRPSLNSNGGEGTSRIMEIVRQISIKGFGSRRDRSGSVKENKSTRPVV
uniref:RING-type E3 ubiquitin transferase n=1 Tax=Kalanchoe fedtschenkoi TaxID=63787 RepID=A0A7N0V5G6_KALFE